nr:MAG: DNA pilot protein [Microvirus sp.]
MAGIGDVGNLAAGLGNTKTAGGALMGDYSSFYSGNAPSVSGADMGRNWLGQLIGLNSESEREDWLRNEQSANNAFYRSMLAMGEQNAFNAAEAQKNRDWTERMSNTAYQRAMADMKEAGLNPVLAYQQGGASTPTGTPAASGSGSASGGGYRSSGRSVADPSSAFLRSISQIVAGLVSKSATTTAAGIAAASSEKVANTVRRSESVSNNYSVSHTHSYREK